MSNKGDLLRAFLEERGVRVPTRAGWTKVSCFNKAAHPRGDRNPSASVNLGKGRYHCFGCEVSGDVYDLLMVEQNLTFPQAQATLGSVEQKAEETWL